MLTKCIIQEKSSKHCLFLGKSYKLTFLGFFQLWHLFNARLWNWSTQCGNTRSFCYIFTNFTWNQIWSIAQNRNICHLFVRKILKFRHCASIHSVHLLNQWIDFYFFFFPLLASPITLKLQKVPVNFKVFLILNLVQADTGLRI